jgi:hypothetical protein
VPLLRYLSRINITYTLQVNVHEGHPGIHAALRFRRRGRIDKCKLYHSRVIATTPIQYTYMYMYEFIQESTEPRVIHVVAYLQSPLANVPTCKATDCTCTDGPVIKQVKPAESRIDQGNVRGGAATRTSSVVIVGRVPSTTDRGDSGTKEGDRFPAFRGLKIKAGGQGVGCLLQ